MKAVIQRTRSSTLAMLIIAGFYFTTSAYATSGQAYLERFMAYTQWSLNLPKSPDPAFLAFVDDTTPLARKLREKWLYQLAYNKDWPTFIQHYQASTDINLQCYDQLALYKQGRKQQVIQAAQTLWLNGSSQPKACDELFNLLLKNNELDEKLITARLILALDNRNLGLARYLLKQYKPPRVTDAQLLTSIYLNPKQISQLNPGNLHGEFYLYGLKRLVSINMKQAMQIWESAKTKQLLNHAQQQAFIAHLTLYKAMRNYPDTQQWFARIEPAFYNDVLLGWEIRYALKTRRWHQVETLIQHIQEQDNPCWQYWLARALEAQGQKTKADAIYQNLAKIRHYYGFLASLRIKKDFSFENERPVSNMQTLLPYQPITDQIRSLYLSKQTLAASRLLNDFLSELPKDDKSALIYWIDHQLQWHGKSVYLSSNTELNNQLSLRFPLAYRDIVTSNAKNYQVPQELVYAIIRQESAFRDDVVSPAGAHGLMQLMPMTAKVVSKHERIAYLDKNQLFSSQKNINIGVAYLQQLSKRFDQHPILMSAAYNAGPRQVVSWLKNHPPKDIDIWVETLPWIETRNYIKNVIAFSVIYQYRMQKKPDLSKFMKPFFTTE